MAWGRGRGRDRGRGRGSRGGCSYVESNVDISLIKPNLGEFSDYFVIINIIVLIKMLFKRT